jgi:hypothetical protein
MSRTLRRHVQIAPERGDPCHKAVRGATFGQDRPTMPDRPQDQQKQNRNRRLSAALRDNLKRRKAQAKGRNLGREAEKAGRDDPSTGTHDSAGFAEDKRNR